MIALEKFLPELRYEFQDLPDELFKFSLVRAARTMARSGDVDVRRAHIQAEPCVTRYAIHPPLDYELVKIISASTESKSLNLVRHKPKSWNVYAHETVIWYDDLECILQIRNIHCPTTIHLNITVCPPDNTCELPFIYYDQYLELLTMGVKANLLRMLNKPWTNLQLAMVYDRAFQQGINELTVDAHMHKTKGIVKMDFGRVL